jgi:hypothetical protein
MTETVIVWAAIIICTAVAPLPLVAAAVVWRRNQRAIDWLQEDQR